MCVFVCVCVCVLEGEADERQAWERERVEDTLRRQKQEMQNDKRWLEQEERLLVRTHTHTQRHKLTTDTHIDKHIVDSTLM